MAARGSTFLAVSLVAAVFALALAALSPTPVAAQDGGGLFAPRMTVNGQVVSNYEYEQRVLFLRALRAPGDPEKEAMRGLIEDRLSQQAAEAADITVSPEDIAAGMTEFASRANLTAEQFAAALAQEGVAPETFRDFVQAGLLWRQLVRDRFGASASVTDVQIERAAAGTARKPEIRVLISELILPAEGAAAGAALDEARRIRDGIASEGGFAAAARQYSASPSAARGGRLDWLPLSNLPPAIGQRLLALAPGEVSEPFVLPQAVVLFQLNSLSEIETASPAEVRVSWAEYALAAGETPEGILAITDGCGDLNIPARGRGDGALVLGEGTMAEVPADTGLELAKLDPGEAVALQRGGRSVLLMLCSREGLRAAPDADPAAEQDAGAQAASPDVAEGGLLPQDRGQIRATLLNQQVALRAAGWMEEMRSEAIITTP